MRVRQAVFKNDNFSQDITNFTVLKLKVIVPNKYICRRKKSSKIE